MTRSRYRIFETEFPYFLTATIVAWLPVFSQPRFVEQIFDSWRFLQANRGIKIFRYVVLESRGDPRQSLQWMAFPGGAWEREMTIARSFPGSAWERTANQALPGTL